MSQASSVRITVPATTANIGPGFDCLGAALSLYNHFTFTRLAPDEESLIIRATGAESDRVQTDARNLAYQAFTKVYDHLGQPVPSLLLEIDLNVPLARGLGSSATAIVGGLVGANALADFPLNRQTVMELAIALEGHPDNVVPALLGGCQLSATTATATWEICDIPWHSAIAPVVAIPNFELSTAAARQVLPGQYSRADAIFNTAHLGLLVRGLATGHEAWLRTALSDRIHQPYRQTLIPGYETVQTEAIAAGAYGVVISGAGPTILALTAPDQAPAVQAAMIRAWATQGIQASAQVLQIDQQGAIVQYP
mgnify:CR=1 FL=1